MISPLFIELNNYCITTNVALDNYIVSSVQLGSSDHVGSV